jgi:hypothetical protein
MNINSSNSKAYTITLMALLLTAIPSIATAEDARGGPHVSVDAGKIVEPLKVQTQSPALPERSGEELIEEYKSQYLSLMKDFERWFKSLHGDKGPNYDPCVDIKPMQERANELKCLLDQIRSPQSKLSSKEREQFVLDEIRLKEQNDFFHFYFFAEPALPVFEEPSPRGAEKLNLKL